MKSAAADSRPGAVPDGNTAAEMDADGRKPSLAGIALPPAPAETQTGRLALSVLATLAFIFALQWARQFFIPLVFGILISYTLNPVVVWLERIRIPRAVGASLVMLALLGSTAVLVSSVYNEAQAIVDELPIAAYKFNNAMKRIDDGELSTLDKLRTAAESFKKAASPTKAATPGAAAAPAPAAPSFNMNDWLVAGSMGVAAFIGQLTMVLFLVFFALMSGNTFKRKLVKLAGPSLTNKKITVHILDDINTSIQRYMFMLLVMNVLLALLTWGALSWIGLENPGAWALAAGLLHVIPYFGPVITAVITGAAAFLQFESFSMMLLVAASTLAIAILAGMLVTTWMTGRIVKMNATAVFVVLLFGGWLWGVWGMLLCVPIIVVLKVISQHIEGMEPIAELLGD